MENATRFEKVNSNKSARLVQRRRGYNIYANTLAQHAWAALARDAVVIPLYYFAVPARPTGC